MDPDKWRRIDDLVDLALDLPENEREAFVRRECEGDEELAGSVLRLVEAHKESDTFLEDSALGVAARTIAKPKGDPEGTRFVGKQFGQYKIEKPIGAGGMGEVYLAFDSKLNRRIAIKVLPESIGSTKEQVARFEQEARAISALNHPGIVTIYDVGEIDGNNFIATEFVEGKTFRELIAKETPLRDVLNAFIQVCDALAAAHRAGIVHRDIKPENLMIREDGYAKILDFGLAKLIGGVSEEDGNLAATKKGMIIGTPAYMSPAQASGERLDGRTDIFSCGIVFYEVLTGRNPFKGESKRRTFERILSLDPPPPSSVRASIPEEVDRIAGKMLEKDPDLGYQSADEVKADLKRIKREIDSSPSLSGGVSSQTMSPRRGFMLPVLGVAAVLAIVAAVAIYFIYGTSGKRPVDWSNAKNTQLTFDAGSEVYPSFSPDGKDFVYASDKDGDYDIYLRRIGGSNETNLTEDSPVDDTMPAYSPGGESIAFRSERDGGGIFLMGATGESPRKVADGGFDPSWSPDGKKLVYATITQEMPSVRSQSQLWIVDVSSGQKKFLLDNFALQPSWSPDGKRIAFWYTENRGKRIVATVPADGGEAVDIASESNTNWNPKWSPTGNYLYYASDRGGNTGFWRVPVDTSTGKATGEHESVPTPAKFNRHPAFSSDGRRLIYVQTAVRSNVLTAPIGTGDKISATPKWLTRGDFEIAAPQILPDGSGYVARLVRETQDDLVFINASTGVLNDLTNDAPFDRYSRISPDGKKIAFASDRSGIYQIWLMNLDGSGLKQVTNTRALASIPAWSPDGKMLSYDSSEQVYVLDMEQFAATGKAEVTMKLPRIDGGGFFRVWDWSPDGRFLAGNFSQAAGSGVGLYDLKTGHYRRLTDFTALPVWMPDGERLLFVNDGRPFFADIISGDVYEAFPEIEGYVRNIAVSPDGKTVYYTLRESESNIWLLDAADASR